MNGQGAAAATQDGLAIRDAFLLDAVDGLGDTPKRIPCKYFYDQRGSELFDRICRLPEYYLTRTELAIMRQHASAMAKLIGPAAHLIELGSGSGLKTRLLLEQLYEPSAYCPVDICREHLMASSRRLADAFPNVPVMPLHADFTGDLAPPHPPRPPARRVVYFPGSTVGNFHPHAAAALLARVARLVHTGGGLLIGVDMKKDVPTLEAAYNDAAGVTKQFNLNLLVRLQRVLDADVQIEQFEHRAFYNAGEGRIEMHLVSKVHQTIALDHTHIPIDAGETIHTENSYKYDLEEFAELAATAGFARRAAFMDDERLFSVQYFEASDEATRRRSDGGMQ